MNRKRKKLISFLLTFALLIGSFTDISSVQAASGSAISGSSIKADVKTEETTTATVEDDSCIKQPFGTQKFLDLYSEKHFQCDDSDMKYDTETVAGNLLVTAKNNKMSKACFYFTQTFDFGDKTINRIQVNALAKRATKTYLKLYLDDETECFTTIRLSNQAKEDSWTRNKTYSFELASLEKKLTGKHTIHFQLVDTTTADDKKTSILLRHIQFVPDSIPVVSLNLDEELGSISGMNNDINHETECYGEMSIRIPDTYTCEFGDAQSLKDTEATYELDYIRGRGNSTWMVDKKPYKIKLAKKADLFGMGANKHWVLLANYYDNSLLRNRITYYIGRELNMEYTPKCVSVDVIMNGEYLGNYLLCEQIRLDENRVDENDLEDEKYTGTDITGGYLLAMSPYRETDLNIFETTRNSYLVESPEKGKHAEAGLKYIKDYVQKTEDAIYNSDFCLPDGTSYRELMDVPSAIAYYWIQEFTMNGDAFISTSTYLYKKQDKDGIPGKLYWGPLWDFDYVAWASYDYSDSPESYSTFFNQRTWFERLVDDPTFAKELKDYWPTLKEALNKVIKKGGILDQYRDEISISATSNFDTWGYTDFSWEDEPDPDKITLNFEQEIERLRTWITRRINWIDENLETITPVEIHLTFMVDGNVYAERTANSGRPITNLPEAPQNDDPETVFGGWYYTYSYTDQETGEELTEELPLYSQDSLNKDTVLTARWIPKDELHEIKNIYFEKSKINVYNGQWFRVNYVIAPLDAMDPAVEWETSDSSVLRYDEDGYWCAEQPGTATITVTAGNGVKASCEVHVISEEEMMENTDKYTLTDLSLDKTEITLKTNEWEKLNIITNPEEAIYDSYLQWICTDSDVAYVSSGVVYAKQPGTAIVILYNPDTGAASTCKVTVEAEDESEQPQPTASATPQPTASAKPTGTPVPTASPSTLTGKSFTAGKLKYKVTADKGNTHTVAVTGMKKNSLNKLTIPSTVQYKKKVYKVTEIKEDALTGQGKLKKLTLGKNIVSIGSGAFRNCKQLKSIVIQSKKLQFVGIRSFTNINKKASYHVPAGKKKTYRKFFGNRVK